MFGFLKFKKVLNETKFYISRLLAPAALLAKLQKKDVPKQIFGDPYVLGFMQQICIFVCMTHHKENDSAFMSAIFVATMDDLAGKGFGQKINAELFLINTTNHPLKMKYEVGQREGKEYILALMKNDEIRQQELLSNITSFLRKNYIEI
jgi:hypothetical protein